MEGNLKMKKILTTLCAVAMLAGCTAGGSKKSSTNTSTKEETAVTVMVGTVAAVSSLVEVFVEDFLDPQAVQPASIATAHTVVRILFMF